MHQEFYSNGKLLLSGEYAILDGAMGLAIPTRYGQSLEVASTNSGILEWTSLDEKQSIWFQGKFSLEDFSNLSNTNNDISGTLTKLLTESRKQNPNFLVDSNGTQVVTKLGFPREWGLGSSSTLINNIAQWAKVDAYQLLWNAFGGSGYDIACAQNNGAITYRLKNHLPQVEKVSFSPPFKDSLYFVYLNQKQSSKQAIANYHKRSFDKGVLVQSISLITQEMIFTKSLGEFETLMVEHERLLGEVLGVLPVKSQLFPDFPGAIKSLGAWGGDFVLVTRLNENPNYFSPKGFTEIVPYSKMVIK